MTAHLLDVNALIALLDPTHVHHDRAHAWFAKTGRRDWLSCPTTQNGVVRIVSHPKYSNAVPTPGVAIESLSSLVAVGNHRFVPDRLSLLDAAEFDRDAFTASGQLTDSYLLGLAKAEGAKLATLDTRLSTAAVTDGDAIVLHIP